MPIEILCHGCRRTGMVHRVTAGLRCSCGSADLDLYEPPDLGSMDFLTAMGVTANSGGTGWNGSHPDELRGWSEYQGPMPGPNPYGQPAHPVRCANCHGSGWSLRERCRACKGSGMHTPPTAEQPEPQVARHPGQTKVPFVGGRKSSDPMGSPEDHIRATTPGYTDRGMRWEPDRDTGMYPRFPNSSPNVKTRQDRDYSQAPAKPLQLDQADCPECGHMPTHLVKDQREDAWWKCPNCGPLVNVDRHPEVNPFNVDTYNGKDKGFKSASRRAVQKTGRVLSMFKAVLTTNPGLSQGDALGIVRRTVQRYSE